MEHSRGTTGKRYPIPQEIKLTVQLKDGKKKYIVKVDIVDSTILWNAAKQDMSDGVETFFGVAKALVLQYKGKLLKFNGDGFYAMFDDSFSACMFCAQFTPAICYPSTYGVPDWKGGLLCKKQAEVIKVQGVIISRGLRARIGVAKGLPEYWLMGDQIDCMGSIMNLTARIETAACVGSTYIHHKVYSEVKDMLASLPVVLRDEGLHTLKGFTEQHRLYSLFPTELAQAHSDSNKNATANKNTNANNTNTTTTTTTTTTTITTTTTNNNNTTTTTTANNTIANNNINNGSHSTKPLPKIPTGIRHNSRMVDKPPTQTIKKEKRTSKKKKDRKIRQWVNSLFSKMTLSN